MCIHILLILTLKWGCWEGNGDAHILPVTQNFCLNSLFLFLSFSLSSLFLHPLILSSAPVSMFLLLLPTISIFISLGFRPAWSCGGDMCFVLNASVPRWTAFWDLRPYYSHCCFRTHMIWGGNIKRYPVERFNITTSWNIKSIINRLFSRIWSRF